MADQNKKYSLNYFKKQRGIDNKGQFLTSSADKQKHSITPHLIMRTKLHAPPVPSDFVPRSLILEQLEKFRNRPFTLISAPAGYGKSTLASSWLKTCGCPSAWVSLDEDANDMRVFLSYFIAAVQTMYPNIGHATQVLLSAPNLPPLSFLTNTLMNDLDQIGEAFVLVLDDYHRISEIAIHDIISGLLHYPPLGMHLMLLTRRDPPLQLGTLRGQGQINEISSFQLQFSPSETGEFLKNSLGLSINEATATIIDEKLEGWPAGLRLMSHSLGDRKDLDRVVSALKGGLSSSIDYLVSEAFSRQPPAILTYMIVTSILNRFCASLCEELCSSQSSQDEKQISGSEFISYLQTNNLFVISLDIENNWFRYHHLFQQLLYRQLQSRFGKAEIAALHARASAWFEKNDLIEGAIRHALAAGDTTHAVQIVHQNRNDLLESDNRHILQNWLSLFEEDVILKHYELLTVRAWMLFVRLDIKSLSSVINILESFLRKARIEKPIIGEIDFFHACISYLQNEGSKTLKYLQNALKNLSGKHCGEAEIYFGLASQMQGRQEDAIKRLRKLLNNSNTINKTRLLGGIIYIHIIAGNLGEALIENHFLSDFARKENFLYTEVWSSYLNGLIHFYRNNLEDAIRCFRQCMEHRYISHIRAAVDCMAGLALSYQSIRQPGEADTIMQSLSEYVDGLNEPAYTLIAHSCQVRLAIMRGDRKSAFDWLAANATSENMAFWLEIPSVTFCRALLAEGSDANLQEAEKKLEEYLQINRNNHNICHVIQTSALLSVIYQKLGKNNKALSTLKDAVATAEHGGFVRPFAELGTSMADLLKQLKKQNVSPNFIETILNAIKDYEQCIPAPSSQNQPMLDPLTNRELEVLGLVAEHLYDKEIAERLHISPETVKTHLRHIYQKLLVGNRRQAITKARDLGMIARK